MDLSKLNISGGLQNDKISCTDFVKVSDYKFLRIAYFSSCKATLQLCWSINGVTTCITENIGVSPLVWRSHKTEVVMEYLKIIIVIPENEVSDNLIINVSGREHSIKKVEKSDNEVTPEELEKLEKVNKINSPSSLRKKVFFNARRKSVEPPPSFDSRLPHLLLNNQLLYTKDKKIVNLAGENPGDLLSHSRKNE
jgi:hypothetical protein